MAPIRRDELDLRFTIIAEPDTHCVDYKIYDIVSSDPICWQAKDSNGFELVDSLDAAEVYLHGGVKWDGCSNWHFDEQDRVMLHGCSRSDVQRFGNVMALCWEWTAELCPEWAEWAVRR